MTDGGNGTVLNGLGDERYSLELRSEILRVISSVDEFRRGDSDTLIAGCSNSSDVVEGAERVTVSGSLKEHVKHARATQADKVRVHVEGKLTVKSKGDTAMIGGTMTESHLGPTLLMAGMSDDMVIGGGARVTAPTDITLAGLLGLEQKIGTAIGDGNLNELYNLGVEREFGPGVMAAGTATFNGAVYQTQASGFMQILRVWAGIRNLAPGAGAGVGGSASAPNGAAPPASAPPVQGAMVAAGGAGGLADAGRMEDMAQMDELVQSAERGQDLATAGEDTATVGEDTATAPRTAADLLDDLQQGYVGNRNMLLVDDGGGTARLEDVQTFDDGFNWFDELGGNDPYIPDSAPDVAPASPLDMQHHFVTDEDLMKANPYDKGTREAMHFEMARAWRTSIDVHAEVMDDYGLSRSVAFVGVDDAMTKNEDPVKALLDFHSERVQSGNKKVSDMVAYDVARSMATYYPDLLEAPTDAGDVRGHLVFDRNRALVGGNVELAKDIQKQIDGFDLTGIAPRLEYPGMDHHFLDATGLEKPNPYETGTREAMHFEMARAWRAGETLALEQELPIPAGIFDEDLYRDIISNTADWAQPNPYERGTKEFSYYRAAKDWMVAQEGQADVVELFKRADMALANGEDPIKAMMDFRLQRVSDPGSAGMTDAAVQNVMSSMRRYYPDMLDAPTDADGAGARLIYDRNMAILDGDMRLAQDIQKQIDDLDVSGAISPLKRRIHFDDLQPTVEDARDGGRYDLELEDIDGEHHWITPGSDFGPEPAQAEALTEMRMAQQELADVVAQLPRPVDVDDNSYTSMRAAVDRDALIRTAERSKEPDKSNLLGLVDRLDQADSDYAAAVNNYITNMPNDAPLPAGALEEITITEDMTGVEEGESVSDLLRQNAGEANSYLDNIQQRYVPGYSFDADPLLPGSDPSLYTDNEDVATLLKGMLPGPEDMESRVQVQKLQTRIKSRQTEIIALRKEISELAALSDAGDAAATKKLQKKTKLMHDLEKVLFEQQDALYQHLGYSESQVAAAIDALKTVQSDLESGLDPIARLDVQIANYEALSGVPTPVGEASFADRADMLKSLRQGLLDIANRYDESGTMFTQGRTVALVDFSELVKADIPTSSLDGPPGGTVDGVASIPPPPPELDSVAPDIGGKLPLADGEQAETLPGLSEGVGDVARYDFTSGDADAVAELGHLDVEAPPAPEVSDVTPAMIPQESPPSSLDSVEVENPVAPDVPDVEVEIEVEIQVTPSVESQAVAQTDPYASLDTTVQLDDTGANWSSAPREKKPVDPYGEIDDLGDLGLAPVPDTPAPVEPPPDFSETWELLHSRRQSSDSSGLHQTGMAHLDDVEDQLNKQISDLIAPYAQQTKYTVEQLTMAPPPGSAADLGTDSVSRLREWYKYFAEQIQFGGGPFTRDSDNARSMRATLASFDRLAAQQVSDGIAHANYLGGLGGFPLPPNTNTEKLTSDLGKKIRNTQREMNIGVMLPGMGADLDDPVLIARLDAYRTAQTQVADGLNPIPYLMDMRQAAESSGDQNAVDGIDQAIRGTMDALAKRDPDFRKPPVDSDPAGLLAWKRNEALYNNDLAGAVDFQRQIDFPVLAPSSSIPPPPPPSVPGSIVDNPAPLDLDFPSSSAIPDAEAPPPKPPRAQPSPQLTSSSVIADTEVQNVMDAVPQVSGSTMDTPPPKPPRRPSSASPADASPMPESARKFLGGQADSQNLGVLDDDLIRPGGDISMPGLGGEVHNVTVVGDDGSSESMKLIQLPDWLRSDVENSALPDWLSADVEALTEASLNKSGIENIPGNTDSSDVLRQATSLAQEGDNNNVSQLHVQASFDEFVNTTDDAATGRNRGPLPEIPSRREYTPEELDEIIRLRNEIELDPVDPEFSEPVTPESMQRVYRADDGTMQWSTRLSPGDDNLRVKADLATRPDQAPYNGLSIEDVRNLRGTEDKRSVALLRNPEVRALNELPRDADDIEISQNIRKISDRFLKKTVGLSEADTTSAKALLSTLEDMALEGQNPRPLLDAYIEMVRMELENYKKLVLANPNDQEIAHEFASLSVRYNMMTSVQAKLEQLVPPSAFGPPPKLLAPDVPDATGADPAAWREAHKQRFEDLKALLAKMQEAPDDFSTAKTKGEGEEWARTDVFVMYNTKNDKVERVYYTHDEKAARGYIGQQLTLNEDGTGAITYPGTEKIRIHPSQRIVPQDDAGNYLFQYDGWQQDFAFQRDKLKKVESILDTAADQAEAGINPLVDIQNEIDRLRYHSSMYSGPEVELQLESYRDAYNIIATTL